MTFVIGLVITLVLIATRRAVSLVYTPRDPLEMSIAGRLQGPTLAHPLGTDQFGRDLLSRVMRGAITSILVGVIAVGIGMLVGVAFGMLSGYFGGWLDEVFMRLVDAIQGFPAILSALLLAAVFRPTLCHLHGRDRRRLPARLRAADPRELPRVPRPRFRGGGAGPRGAGTARSSAGTSCPTPCPRSSCRPPSASRWPSWPRPACPIWGSAPSRPTRRGGSCSGRRRASSALNPWYAIFPGGAIALTVLGLNLLGDGLRDLLDPKTVA